MVSGSTSVKKKGKSINATPGEDPVWFYQKQNNSVKMQFSPKNGESFVMFSIKPHSEVFE